MSSAKLTVVPSAPPPIPAQDVQDAVARILHLCNSLESKRDRLLESLPQVSDDVVIEIRMSARAVGVWAWLIEAACDAELKRRTPPQKGGRGKKDIEGAGRKAAYGQQAYLDGKSIRTVERNIQIIETFGTETCVTHGASLQDKGFFIAALSAPEPKAALEMFGAEKDRNAFFEVQDAWSLVSELNAKAEKQKRKQRQKQAADATPPELKKLHEKAVREEIDAKILALEQWPQTTAEPLLASVYRRCIEILKWQRDRTLEADCMAIMKIFATEEGAEAPYRVSDDYISAWLTAHGFIMGDAELDDRLSLLMRLRMITEESRTGSKGDVQRGVVTPVYGPDPGYSDHLDDISLNPRAPERLAAMHKDWIERLTRYAPELLPSKEEKAAT